MKRADILTLEPDEMAAVYAALYSPRNITPTRTLAMLRLMEATGLRSGECRVLTLDSLRRDGDLVRVIVPNVDGAKVGARSVAYLAERDGNPTETHKAVSAWLVARERVCGESDYLFVSNRGGIVDRADFSRYVARVGRQVLGKRVTAHMWRHTAITRWVREVGLAQACDMAGHADIRMTMRYTHLASADRDDVARRCAV